MTQGNYIFRLFDIMEEFGEDTDVPLALIKSEQDPVRWFYFRHQEVDGVGAFYLAQKRQGVQIEIPRYRGAVPKTWQRFILAWRKFRTQTPAPVQWRHWQPSADGKVKKHSQALLGQLLTEDQTRQAQARAKQLNVTMNSLLLWSLNAAVAPVLTLPQAERAWGNTVNMRGQVAAEKITDNQSSIVTVVFSDEDSAVQLHGKIQALFNAGMQWGSWDFLSTVCRVGPNLVRKQIRRYYSNNNSQMGTFSNLGVWNWDVDSEQAPYMYFAPCCTRTAPIAAAAGTLNGRLSMTLGLHSFLQTSDQQIATCMNRWVALLLGTEPGVIAPVPEPAESA